MYPTRTIGKPIISLLILGILLACNNQNTKKNDNYEFTSPPTQQESVCRLLTKADLRETFKVPNTTAIKQQHHNKSQCGYYWNSAKVGSLVNHLSLKLNPQNHVKAKQLDSLWKSENKKDRRQQGKIQAISGIGDRASWSSERGFKLRVAARGNVFSISFLVLPMRKNPFSNRELIDKSSSLAKKVIERL